MAGSDDDIIRQLISTVASIAGSYLSTASGFILPLGSVLTLMHLYYKFFHKDPLRASDKELRRHIHEAIEKEVECRRALEGLRRVKSRVERGEIEVESTVSLEARMKQLDECVKLARAKKMVCEAIIMVKENIGIYKELFGDRGFIKLANNPDELDELVEKAFKKAGIERVEYKEIAEYLRNLTPIIIKEPEKFREASQAPATQPKLPQQVGEVAESIIISLINNGSVQDWIDLLNRSVKDNVMIKLPPGRYSSKEGFKNLLIALYTTELDINAVRRVMKGRYLIRAANYLRRLREGKMIEVDPLSSDKDYIDEILEIINEGEVEKRVEGNTVVKIYGFTTSDGKQVKIERLVEKDPIKGRAIKISYRKIEGIEKAG